MGAPVYGTAAHGVVHQRRNGAVFVVDGVVHRKLAHVGVGTEVGLAVQLPVVLVGGVGPRVDSASLLQTQHVHARTGEAPGDRRSRRARADYQYVDRVGVRGQWSLPQIQEKLRRFRIISPAAGHVCQVGVAWIYKSARFYYNSGDRLREKTARWRPLSLFG